MPIIGLFCVRRGKHHHQEEQPFLREQKVLCHGRHFFLILMGHPCHCLKAAFQILLHTSCIPSPSWWTGIQRIKSPAGKKTRGSATEMPSSFFYTSITNCYFKASSIYSWCYFNSICLSTISEIPAFTCCEIETKFRSELQTRKMLC